MGNPLLILGNRPWARRSRGVLRRVVVRVPTEVPTTDAIFVVLRRMRAPLIVLIVVFAISVFGLAVIPGVDDDGNPVHLTVFEAFYFMSYTATTIGFGEVPYTFTTAQRMWVTASIYCSVIGWAYAIGTLFALIQDQSFREAIGMQRFRRQVRRLQEPFHIVAGYGQAGRLVGQTLDHIGRRFVIVDKSRERVESVDPDELHSDVPALEADAANPAVLGLAGLGNSRCERVLALTDSDETNLAIVMAATLLRPGLPVIARANTRDVAASMREFGADTVINPFDRYGAYLVLALQHPTTYQVITWLMSQAGTPLPELRDELASGRWVVCADGSFGREVTADLRRAGLQVDLVDPADGLPDLHGVSGFVAGATQDTTNLRLAAQARHDNADIFICLRQMSHRNAPLLTAFGLDSVFIPTELVARECLARIITPVFWAFLGHVGRQDDAWSAQVRDRIIERCGHRTPHSHRVILTARHAPATVRWLRHHRLPLGDLLRHPADRTDTVRALPIALIRDDDVTFLPDDDQLLREGDQLVLLGRSHGFADITDALFHDSAIEYVATGRQVPSTWVWRVLTRRRPSRGRPSPGKLRRRP